MSFGVPPSANAIRPRIASVIEDALYDRKRDARADPPAPTDPFYRCAVCTLVGGTCEHTPAVRKRRSFRARTGNTTLTHHYHPFPPTPGCEYQWINKKAQDLLTSDERSAGINRDSVDAQLSDLVLAMFRCKPLFA